MAASSNQTPQVSNLPYKEANTIFPNLPSSLPTMHHSSRPPSGSSCCWLSFNRVAQLLFLDLLRIDPACPILVYLPRTATQGLRLGPHRALRRYIPRRSPTATPRQLRILQQVGQQGTEKPRRLVAQMSRRCSQLGEKRSSHGEIEVSPSFSSC